MGKVNLHTSIIFPDDPGSDLYSYKFRVSELCVVIYFVLLLFFFLTLFYVLVLRLFPFL